jgi:hypothetical protein
MIWTATGMKFDFCHRNAKIFVVCDLFHRAWCNLSRVPKSYVKEALQHTPNVLPSGPFKKVSERPTE